jgi:hypothetical protein
MFAHSDEMLELQSGGVFALRYPEHEFSRGVARMALGILGTTRRPQSGVPGAALLPQPSASS